MTALPTSAGFSLNLDMAKKYYSEMMKLKKTLKLKDDLKVAQIVAMPEVLIFEQQKEKVNHHWPQVKDAVDEALKKLSRMRSAEGKRLEKDLKLMIRHKCLCKKFSMCGYQKEKKLMNKNFG